MMEELVNSLSYMRIEYIENEQDIHEEVKRLFDLNGIEYEYEYRLGKGNRIDFYIPEQKIGIEVKKKRPNKTNLLKQIKRYLGFDSIDKIIVLSERSVNLPEYVEGKEVKTMSINSLWF